MAVRTLFWPLLWAKVASALGGLTHVADCEASADSEFYTTFGEAESLTLWVMMYDMCLNN